MVDLKQKTLALFFSWGVSLKTWQELGSLEREIKPYKELAEHFKQIYFFTYDRISAGPTSGGLTSADLAEVRPELIKVFPKKWNLPSVPYSLLLPLLYRKELKKADILKTNQMSGAWVAVLAKWLFRKKLIVRCGYEWLNVLEKERKPKWKQWLVYLIERIVYRAADRIIFTSQKDKKFAQQRFNIPSSKIEIIPNYIDIELFRPLAIEKEKNRIIFVGRLAKEKNLFNLIKAVSNLPVTLVIIGKGPLGEALERFAKEQEANVEFKGKVPNERLPQELNKSEIFVLPSFYESSPKALLEAMSCGLPCIGTNVEGINEIIRHQEKGYLCTPEASSIKKALLEVLENSPLREKISQGARKTILANFSLEKILEKETKLYESL